MLYVFVYSFAQCSVKCVFCKYQQGELLRSNIPIRSFLTIIPHNYYAYTFIYLHLDKFASTTICNNQFLRITIDFIKSSITNVAWKQKLTNKTGPATLRM